MLGASCAADGHDPLSSCVRCVRPIRAEWQLPAPADYCDRRLDRLSDLSCRPVELGGGFTQRVGYVEGRGVRISGMCRIEPCFAKSNDAAPADRRQLAGGCPVFAGQAQDQVVVGDEGRSQEPGAKGARIETEVPQSPGALGVHVVAVHCAGAGAGDSPVQAEVNASLLEHPLRNRRPADVSGAHHKNLHRFSMRSVKHTTQPRPRANAARHLRVTWSVAQSQKEAVKARA